MFKKFILSTITLSVGSIAGMEAEIQWGNLGRYDEEGQFQKLTQEEKDLAAEKAKGLGDVWLSEFSGLLSEFSEGLSEELLELSPQKMIEKIQYMSHKKFGEGTVEEMSSGFKDLKYVWKPRLQALELFQLLEDIDNEENNISIEAYKQRAIELVRSGADLSEEFQSKLYNEKKQPLILAFVLASDCLFADGKDNRFYALSEIAAEMIKCGADLEARDDAGYTPLMSACFAGDSNNVQLLLEYGVDQNVQNHQGQTACDIAEDKGYTKIIAVLAEKKWTKELAQEPAKKKQRLSKEEE